MSEYDHTYEPVRLMSATNIRVSNSLKCVPKIDAFLDKFDLFDEATSSLAGRFYDQQGLELDDVERLMPEHLRDYMPAHFEQIVEGVESVVFSEHYPVETKDNDREPIKSLNAAIVATIHTHRDKLYADSDVLILCAGNGEDLVRISNSVPGKLPNVDCVGASAFNDRARVASKLCSSIRVTSAYLQNLPPGYLRKYDLILCHMGVHHILRTREGEVAFSKLLRENLKPNGLFVGDFVNVVGIRSMNDLFSSLSNNVKLIDHNPLSTASYVEGSMRIRVGDMVWTDPVLSYERLLGLVPSDLRFDVIQGRTYFTTNKCPRVAMNGRPMEVPSTIRTACSRGEAQVISVFEAWRPYTSTPIDPEVVVPGSPVGRKWKLVDKVTTDVALSLRAHQIVKGRHIGKRDLYFLMNEPHLYSRKMDGLQAKMLFRGCDVWAQVVDGRLYRMPGVERGDSDDWCISCECMGTIDSPIFVYSEVVSFGTHTPRSFIARHVRWRHEVSSKPNLLHVIRNKEWFSECPFDIAEFEGWEGIVAMSPSTDRNLTTVPLRAKQAVYIKVRPTIDIKQAGKIVEVDAFNGGYVRDRPDKSEPNDENTIDMVRSSVPWSVVKEAIVGSPCDTDDVVSVLKWVRLGCHGENPHSIASLHIIRGRWTPIPGFVYEAGYDREWTHVRSRPSILLGADVPEKPSSNEVAESSIAF